MDRFLVAVILLDFIFFSIFRVPLHVFPVLFLAVDLLVVLLLIFSAFFHSFVLVHQLVFLNHPLEVLEDHLARQKASNQSLDLNYGYESTFIYLYAILIVIIFIFDNVFPWFNLCIILIIVLNCIFVLFFIRPYHHMSAVFIFFVSVAELATLPVVRMILARLYVAFNML